MDAADPSPITTPVIDFSKFQLDRVIEESACSKSITFQGKYNDQSAVIRLEKTPFDVESVRLALKDDQLTADRSLINDIYSRYTLQPPTNNQGINDLKTIVVVPANEAVLTKYSRSESILYKETADIYARFVEPFISNMLKNDQDYNQWVYNILEGRSEADHVLFNDTNMDSGFMLIPSLKSSGDDRDVHLLAICHRRDIRSLRDLNENHLPLLKNIEDIGIKTIKRMYDECRGQIRAYIHYHPTFYHFHVHFQLIDPNEYRSSDRDNLLSQVINNISILSNYYQISALTYPLSKQTGLYKNLVSNCCLNE